MADPTTQNQPAATQARTPQQTLDLLRRTQDQAEKRVQLGLELLKAAEDHTSRQHNVIQEVKAEQSLLREQVKQDMAQGLTKFDQTADRFDVAFNRNIEALDQRIQSLLNQWTVLEKRITSLTQRAETILDHSIRLFDQPQANAEPETQSNSTAPDEPRVARTQSTPETTPPTETPAPEGIPYRQIVDRLTLNPQDQPGTDHPDDQAPPTIQESAA